MKFHITKAGDILPSYIYLQKRIILISLWKQQQKKLVKLTWCLGSHFPLLFKLSQSRSCLNPHSYKFLSCFLQEWLKMQNGILFRNPCAKYSAQFPHDHGMVPRVDNPLRVLDHSGISGYKVTYIICRGPSAKFKCSKWKKTKNKKLPLKIQKYKNLSFSCDLSLITMVFSICYLMSL